MCVCGGEGGDGMKKRREAPTEAATVGSGSSWLDLRLAKMSAVAWRLLDHITRKRGKCNVRSTSLLIRLVACSTLPNTSHVGGPWHITTRCGSAPVTRLALAYYDAFWKDTYGLALGIIKRALRRYLPWGWPLDNTSTRSEAIPVMWLAP